MGSIFTASDAAKWMEEQNRTSEGYRSWRQMYGAIDLAKQRSINQATLSTEEGMSEAYAEAFAAKQAVDKSNYFDTYKQQLDDKINKSLEEAYDNYIKNYNTELYQIENTAAEKTQAIDTALATQGEYVSKVADSAYTYLQNLYDTYYSDLNKRKELQEKGFDWNKYEISRYLKDDVDEEGNIRTDEEGNPLKLLKTWDELVAGDATTTGLFERTESGDRMLSQAGIDFYDMLLNTPYYDYGIKSYDEWLRETDEDLYSWYTSYNPYVYAPKTEGGNDTTGASLFRQFAGMQSYDQKYSFMERFGGMSKEVLDEHLSDITKNIEELGEITDSKKIITKSKELVDNFRSVADKFGITNELNEELKAAGLNWEDVDTALSQAVDNYENPAGAFFKSLGMTVGAGAAAGGAIGAGAGTVALTPGLGTFVGGGLGALFGAIGGALGGIVTGSVDTVNTKKNNERRAEQAKQTAISAMYSMIAQLDVMRAEKTGSVTGLNATRQAEIQDQLIKDREKARIAALREEQRRARGESASAQSGSKYNDFTTQGRREYADKK